MKSNNCLVVYDSLFGNTEKIALAVGQSMKAKVIHISKSRSVDLKNFGLIVIGTPTQGGRATSDIQSYINEIPSGVIKSAKFAVFDTRFDEKIQNFALKMLLKVLGYASPKMALSLKSKGATLLKTPEGFIVKDKEGPLAEGEIERAKKWLLNS